MMEAIFALAMLIGIVVFFSPDIPGTPKIPPPPPPPTQDEDEAAALARKRKSIEAGRAGRDSLVIPSTQLGGGLRIP